MSKYYIGLDNGGTYIKAGLFDENGSQLYLEKETSVAVAEKGGRVELDPEALWEANCRCVSRLIKNNNIPPENIYCIGIAGQGKGLYLVDQFGKPVRNAITSADGRSWEYAKKWKENGVAETIFQYTYQGLFASHPVTMLAWMKDHERDNYDKIRWIFSMKDYLVYCMTGIAVADPCNQSGGSFLNLNTGEYEPEILKLLGIEEMQDKLPPIMNSDEICGTVTEEAAEKMGCLAGTKVIAGMFDVDASAIGMGIVDDSVIGIITGTCGINAYISKEPVRNHSVLMNSCYCIPGYYYIEEGSNTSAGVLEWVINVLFPREKDEDGDHIYTQMNKIVEGKAVNDSEIIFLPYLYGSALNSKSRGCWVGLSPTDTREDMLRAVYEGVVFSHKWHVERLLKNRKAPDRIRISGGATNSQVWLQMFADVLQIPIEVVEGQEIGVKGLAMVEGIACGLYQNYDEAAKKNSAAKRIIYPQVDMAEMYQKKYEKYLSVSQNLDSSWDLFDC